MNDMYDNIEDKKSREEYTIVYVIGIPFLAIAVFSSFLTQYTPDFIKNVFCIWWWVQC